MDSLAGVFVTLVLNTRASVYSCYTLTGAPKVPLSRRVEAGRDFDMVLANVTLIT